MFGFFKKKPSAEEQDVPIFLSEAQRIELMQQVEQKTGMIDKLTIEEPEKTQQLAGLYEEVGLLYAELELVDEGIAALEKSLTLKLSIGEGYKKLLQLYNTKRAAAAKAGDDTEIEKYMGKMDDMRQIAKRGTLSR